MITAADLASRPWRLDPRVELRAESFGALAYHFGTRRLSFLKSTRLREAVEALEGHPDGRSACLAVGVSEEDLPSYHAALAQLADGGMIVPRELPAV